MINNFPLTNIYEKPKSNSKLSSQMLYGEKFKIISKKDNWLKIKTNYDNYVGFIKKKKFAKKLNLTFKIFSLKSNIYTKKNNKFKKTNKFLYFGSRISIKNEYKNFFEYAKNKWIKKGDTKKIDTVDKNFIKILKLFLNSRYLWGGKTADGIDCSSLIQIYFYYNRTFFPRDTKDQIKFCKSKLKNTFSKGDVIFWKGHVGLCINQYKFIHAYGPKKRVVIMPINYTINLIDKTANLVIKKISNIKNY